MRISARGNVIVESVSPGVQVMRFARPDVRKYLWDDADAPTSPLFREIQDTALSNLADGSALIVNMGLIDPINAAFYRCLLCIRKSLQASHGQLVLCGLSPEHQEVFDLLRGPQIFTIARTEAEALRVARRWLRDAKTSLEEDISPPLTGKTSRRVRNSASTR
jgi:anti-anti-sigma regulatory factor